MKYCRDCKHQVSEDAIQCPNCGAPYPAREQWDGYGFEYKSEAEVLGYPLIHISFKYRKNFMPVPAKGVIAIGQFSAGLVSIGQFSVGAITVGQFVVGGLALAQFAAAYSLVAQIGVYINQGYGQVVYQLGDVIRKITG
jgi:hypothetical protein